MTYMGTGAARINRRDMLGGVVALAAAPALARRSAITVLEWRGRAHIDVDRALDLIAETRIELPLLRVRSTSWIVEQGPAAARTMILDPDGAWIERAGMRTPLPPQLAIHERQQYAIYALLFAAGSRRRKPGAFLADAPPLPPVRFTIGADGYPIAADLTVYAPEDDKPRIAEHAEFRGRIDSNGVRWPRRFVIAQDGKPYFDMTLDRFTAS